MNWEENRSKIKLFHTLSGTIMGVHDYYDEREDHHVISNPVMLEIVQGGIAMKDFCPVRALEIPEVSDYQIWVDAKLIVRISNCVNESFVNLYISLDKSQKEPATPIVI